MGVFEGDRDVFMVDGNGGSCYGDRGIIGVRIQQVIKMAKSVPFAPVLNKYLKDPMITAALADVNSVDAA